MFQSEWSKWWLFYRRACGSHLMLTLGLRRGIAWCKKTLHFLHFAHFAGVLAVWKWCKWLNERQNYYQTYCKFPFIFLRLSLKTSHQRSHAFTEETILNPLNQRLKWNAVSLSWQCSGKANLADVLHRSLSSFDCCHVLVRVLVPGMDFVTWKGNQSSANSFPDDARSELTGTYSPCFKSKQPSTETFRLCARGNVDILHCDLRLHQL